jgi:hypothetical protein
MGTVETEALATALEMCAAELEHSGSLSQGPQAGSLPRLRPPVALPATSRIGGFAPPADLDTTDAMLQDLRELAAEFREAAGEVRRGDAGPGWINALVGRASRFLDEAKLADVQAAARGVF